MQRPRTLTAAVLLTLCVLLLAAAPAVQAARRAGPRPAPAAPQGVALGSAFTYQGNLKKSGQPANATCGFQFRLWDAATAGTQQGTTQTVSNVTVQGGLFTVQLDFGPVFTGDGRWLETAVQCAGDASYTALAPRQLLTAAPYAQGLMPGAKITSQNAADAITVEQNADANGIHGQAYTATSVAVRADNDQGIGLLASSSASKAVWGASVSGPGVYGESNSAPGVVGTSAEANGIEGSSTAAGGYGVKGTAGPSGVGVYGETTAATGVFGAATTGFGMYGAATEGGFGTVGVALPNGIGVEGESHDGTGVHGASLTATGVWGTSTSGSGVKGESTSGYGVEGSSTTDGGVGIRGSNDTVGGRGVAGVAQGDSGIGVFGEGTYIGVWGDSAGNPSGYAGYFQGNVNVTGNLSKGGGSFKIDHPLDPLNKYLSHSFVESPDMKNIYDGVATLDAQGEATVQLPDWFEALNRDFRYQLTCIGGYAPVYIGQEMTGNQFKIAGGRPGLKVSWQVTGIRHDPYAEQNRIVVEQDKTGAEKGKYLYPSAYGQPATEGIAASVAPASAGVASKGPARAASGVPTLGTRPPGVRP